MMTVISHIEYLVKEHECVIIPGFGAFITYYTPSCVTSQNVLIPPKLFYGFNGAIRHNDGLLANSIMRKSGVSYDEAVDIIERDVKVIKSQLSDSGEFIFGEIGTFGIADDEQIMFEPNDRISYSKSEMFGLYNISLSEAGSESRKETHENKDVVYLPLRKDFFRIAASIIVLVVLAFALSTPVSVDDMPDYAGLKFGTEKNIVEPVVTNDVIATEKRIDSSELVNQSGIANPENENSDSEVTNQNEAEDHDYYLVVATFRTKKQALLYIKQSGRDEELNVLDNGGNLYRVYVASGDSYKELNSELVDVSVANPDAWIYKNTRKRN